MPRAGVERCPGITQANEERFRRVFAVHSTFATLGLSSPQENDMVPESRSILAKPTKRNRYSRMQRQIGGWGWRVRMSYGFTLLIAVFLGASFALDSMFTRAAAHPGNNSEAAALLTIWEFPIPSHASGPESITIGPDNALWFVEANANKIARITLTGSITEYRIPRESSGAQSITTGPDGALWFVEANVNRVARITTSGVITEFRLPSAFS